MANSTIIWLQNWYNSQCNGDWEHSFGIRIGTLDNPGWSVKINIKETNLESYEFDSGLIENNNNDWYTYKFEDGEFKAYGDPSKLEFLLSKFKEEIEKS
jgi:hypothetical protein